MYQKSALKLHEPNDLFYNILDSNFYIKIDMYNAKDVNYYVRHIFVQDADDMSDQGQGISIERQETTVYDIAPDYIVRMYIRADTYQNYYSIKRYNWYDAIGTVGGMQSFI